MSKITNEAKIKNPLIVAIREQLEHRALWMYLLCDEAKKKGLAPKNMPLQLSDDAACIRVQTCAKKQ
ncbi:MAG: hypothetical protein J6C76_05565, partial [Oscillospiraceae bacterium]|nr:hypothetical protein [Oscillospiraceae bacterium]